MKMEGSDTLSRQIVVDTKTLKLPIIDFNPRGPQEYPTVESVLHGPEAGKIRR